MNLMMHAYMFIGANESTCLYYGILLRIYHYRAYMIPDQGLFEMTFSKVCIPNENGV